MTTAKLKHQLMKRFYTPLALVCLVAFAQNATAAEKIEGAFGMKLGEVFEPAKAVGKSELTDGTPMYEFAPEKTFRSFKKYFVLITPKTNRIYSIWGIGSAENTPTAQKEQALIMEILRQKYGEGEKQGIFDAMTDLTRVNQGERQVMVKISGITDVTIDIRYYDAPLTKLAEKERLEIEAKKVDSSSL